VDIGAVQYTVFIDLVSKMTFLSLQDFAGLFDFEHQLAKTDIPAPFDFKVGIVDADEEKSKPKLKRRLLVAGCTTQVSVDFAGLRLLCSVAKALRSSEKLSVTKPMEVFRSLKPDLLAFARNRALCSSRFRSYFKTASSSPIKTTWEAVEKLAKAAPDEATARANLQRLLDLVKDMIKVRDTEDGNYGAAITIINNKTTVINFFETLDFLPDTMKDDTVNESKVACEIVVKTLWGELVSLASDEDWLPWATWVLGGSSETVGREYNLDFVPAGKDEFEIMTEFALMLKSAPTFALGNAEKTTISSFHERFEMLLDMSDGIAPASVVDAVARLEKFTRLWPIVVNQCTSFPPPAEAKLPVAELIHALYMARTPEIDTAIAVFISNALRVPEPEFNAKLAIQEGLLPDLARKLYSGYIAVDKVKSLLERYDGSKTASVMEFQSVMANEAKHLKSSLECQTIADMFPVPVETQVLPMLRRFTTVRDTLYKAFLAKHDANSFFEKLAKYNGIVKCSKEWDFTALPYLSSNAEEGDLKSFEAFALTAPTACTLYNKLAEFLDPADNIEGSMHKTCSEIAMKLEEAAARKDFDVARRLVALHLVIPNLLNTTTSNDSNGVDIISLDGSIKYCQKRLSVHLADLGETVVAKVKAAKNGDPVNGKDAKTVISLSSAGHPGNSGGGASAASTVPGEPATVQEGGAKKFSLKKARTTTA